MPKKLKAEYVCSTTIAADEFKFLLCCPLFNWTEFKKKRVLFAKSFSYCILEEIWPLGYT